jgi:hypothetical protein
MTTLCVVEICENFKHLNLSDIENDQKYMPNNSYVKPRNDSILDSIIETEKGRVVRKKNTIVTKYIRLCSPAKL